jgi:hypothetical protein
MTSRHGIVGQDGHMAIQITGDPDADKIFDESLLRCCRG